MLLRLIKRELVRATASDRGCSKRHGWIRAGSGYATNAGLFFLVAARSLHRQAFANSQGDPAAKSVPRGSHDCCCKADPPEEPLLAETACPPRSLTAVAFATQAITPKNCCGTGARTQSAATAVRGWRSRIAVSHSLAWAVGSPCASRRARGGSLRGPCRRASYAACTSSASRRW